ncbi:hypothetical protein GDO81_013935 [Engystomops pustulosus]|uniref:Uncharacterized protein n=1 Tax=Engystomops pustulosus TaxID=76066 RepID=A0AAV7B6N4_ENGPU|nr:hypothetical protein GDO81_013935 [Engystomops pustulosus]
MKIRFLNGRNRSIGGRCSPSLCVCASLNTGQPKLRLASPISVRLAQTPPAQTLAHHPSLCVCTSPNTGPPKQAQALARGSWKKMW